MTASKPKPDVATKPRKPRRHCNALDGKRWLQNSISVWSDIRKTSEETKLKHPAMFPGMLAERLIETFLSPEGTTVLDPFCGSGSTLLAATKLGNRGIGFELSPEYAALAEGRLADQNGEAGGRGWSDVRSETPEELPTGASRPTCGRCPPSPGHPTSDNGDATWIIHQASATELTTYVPADSIDLCISSPPYWDILNQRRTADFKDVRHYGNLEGDIGSIADYEQFLAATTAVYADVFTTLKPGGYCCIIVMDLRKKNRFFPLHSDLAGRLSQAGYIFDDLIIWNRQSEYNNLRPLGYPSVFRVNKVHEFVVLLQKPRIG